MTILERQRMVRAVKRLVAAEVAWALMATHDDAPGTPFARALREERASAEQALLKARAAYQRALGPK